MPKRSIIQLEIVWLNNQWCRQRGSRWFSQIRQFSVLLIFIGTDRKRWNKSCRHISTILNIKPTLFQNEDLADALFSNEIKCHLTHDEFPSKHNKSNWFYLALLILNLKLLSVEVYFLLPRI